MPELYLGLISGTSVDGIDSVILSIDDNDIEDDSVQVVASECYPIPTSLAADIHQLCSTDTVAPKQLEEPSSKLSITHNEFGQVLAEAALSLLSAARIRPQEIVAIGSHGQTVHHRPPSQDQKGFSVQIGCAKTLTERTGIDTVSNFRMADMQRGGQGAPLAPAFHLAIAPTDKKTCGFLNLGGIANISIIENRDIVCGYDTGPANTLMDSWTKQQIGKNYDESGAWSATGFTHPALLASMLSDPFFKLAAPRSTGRELFNLKWLQHHLQQVEQTLAPENVQATLLALSSQSIANEVDKLSTRPEIIFCCGGGAHNKTLIQAISDRLPDIDICDTGTLGVNVDYVEASLFAWLAKKRIKEEKIDLRKVTGASEPCLLGDIETKR